MGCHHCPKLDGILFACRSLSLNADALQKFEIKVLDFPYQSAIDEFLAGLQPLLRRDRFAGWQYPPYRLLNSAIIACAPTVVHGFEDYRGVRRMLAVGKPIYDRSGVIVGLTLCYPSEEQIAQLIQIWV
jgi:hypothetical protein